MMTKEEARRFASGVWRDLTPVLRKTLVRRFDEFLEKNEYRRAFGTVPVGEELDLLTILEMRGLPIYLPVAHKNGLMSFHYYAAGAARERLTPGLFGISVPPDGEAVVPGEGDLCVIPALACNPGGFRLGRGGGYYDRFFSAHSAAKNCRKVCVLPVRLSEILFSEQLHDLKMDEVLTDT